MKRILWYSGSSAAVGVQQGLGVGVGVGVDAWERHQPKVPVSMPAREITSLRVHTTHERRPGTPQPSLPRSRLLMSTDPPPPLLLLRPPPRAPTRRTQNVPWL
eukprot:TRINITY_DN2769_c1_g1_i1.p1 TRINITY_DN2769_c1_g1~~TRINITY_DN2769_c1_g1_i1.p1  ORF type:complete len:103 (-),score=3.99 TRINITY_DN2769_c1_g1_i1:201-509(-)